MPEFPGAYRERSMLLPADDKPMPTADASRLMEDMGFRVAPATLAVKRVRGGGPEYVKFGRRVLYKPSALREWIEGQARVLTNTSQAA
jgi:hypothetical protein